MGLVIGDYMDEESSTNEDDEMNGVNGAMVAPQQPPPIHQQSYLIQHHLIQPYLIQLRLIQHRMIQSNLSFTNNINI